MNTISRLTLVLIASVLAPAFAQSADSGPDGSDLPAGTVKFEVPLNQLSNLPILAGYEGNTPDENLITYVLPVCKALGYEDAVDSTTSFRQPGTLGELTVYDQHSLRPRTTVPERPGVVGVLTRLVCVKIAGS